jgi:hypothetical protein
LWQFVAKFLNLVPQNFASCLYAPSITLWMQN